MEIIMPAAGMSTRFPNMRPKYTLTDFSGAMMFEKAIAPYLDKHHITIGVLKEHEEKYHVSKFILEKYLDKISVVILENRTAGPADTVYQILKQINLPDEEDFLIKDCDSFFDHEYQEGNYICVSSIKNHDVVKRLSSKSFIITNNQGIVTSIIEKQIVSDKFCVGGYKFESATLFIETYEKLISRHVEEIFVSHIIEECLERHIFKESIVTDYIDVGTAEEWFEYNDKSVIFCDIDGTIIEAQAKHDYYNNPIPLLKNIEKIKQLSSNGGKIIFTTARPKKYDDRTKEILINLGFENFDLISDLPNTKRILINDFNEANPYPRAIAVNIKRDHDTLGDFL